MTDRFRSRFVLTAFALAAAGVAAHAQTTGRPSVYQTTLEEAGQKTPEITTQELQAILASGSEPVFDVRTAEEYAIAHIPGSINIYELEVQRIVERLPDRGSPMILYCNGPSCGKSKRTSEQLVDFGYTHVRRYQLGLPVWRALSLTVQTDLPGLQYMYTRDHTAVWVDARTPAEFQAGSMPGAVNVQPGEATAANDDGRLPFRDKGTRIVVFGNTAQQAKVVAAEIAKKAYWNSSYFGGALIDLLLGGLINHPPVAIARNATIAAGPACTAAVVPSAVDGGSYDIDTGNTLTLSVDAVDPLAPGKYAVMLKAVDNFGASSSAPSEVTVADQTAPTIEGLAIDVQGVRGPGRDPRNNLKVVTIEYAAADNCGPISTELSVVSRERGESEWRVVDDHHVLLKDAGDRLWFIVTATDGAGNRSTQRIAFRHDDH